MSGLRRAGFSAALGLLLAGCFEPAKPDVGFLCGTGGACPAGYECRDTGCCHRIGSPERECSAPSDAAVSGDAAVDAAAGDAAVDAAVDAALPDAAIPDAAIPDAAIPDAAPPDAAVDAMPPAPRRR